MKLAFITPTSYLEKFASQGDFYLALAHLIDEEGKNDYTTFHRSESRSDKCVILDNGLFEGAQVSVGQLLRRARFIDARVVAAPDVLFDSKGTIKAFKEFIKQKQEFGLVAKVMGIPQADNATEWWDCFHFMNTHPDCDIIGLSILSIPKCFDTGAGMAPITISRMDVIRQLYSYQVFGGPVKQCHLLGLGEAYGDVLLANKLMPNTIVSNDSSSAFVHGMRGVTYDRYGGIRGGKIKEKLDFRIGNLLRYEENDIQKNIDIAKRLANGT